MRFFQAKAGSEMALSSYICTFEMAIVKIDEALNILTCRYYT